jgi:hypothetical protein
MSELRYYTERTNVPVCPYCGRKDHNWWEWVGQAEGGEQTCGWCEREYRWSVRHCPEFTTTAAPSHE